jgi:hypothetical protein
VARTVGLGPTSYQGGYQATGAPMGVGAQGGLVGAAARAGGTPEGHALIVLVILELAFTGLLRQTFRRQHGG